MEKSPDAFRTISEVADLLETPAHVLRFWETRFPQVRPVKRAGGRRYYRPADIALLAGIRALLHDRGMTIRGVQKILREQGVRHVMDLPEAAVAPVAAAGPVDLSESPGQPGTPGVEVSAEAGILPEAAIAPLDLSDTGMDPPAGTAPADVTEEVAGQGVAIPADLQDRADQPGGVAEPAVPVASAPRLSLVPAAPPMPDPTTPAPAAPSAAAGPMPEDTAPQPEDAAMDPRQSDLFDRPAAPPGDSAPPLAPETLPESLPETLPESLPETLPESLPESLPETLPESLADPEPAAQAGPAPDSVPAESAAASAPAPLPETAAEGPAPETGAAPTAAARLRRLGPAALGPHRAALLSVHARLTDLHRRHTAAARGRRG